MTEHVLQILPTTADDKHFFGMCSGCDWSCRRVRERDIRREYHKTHANKPSKLTLEEYRKAQESVP